MELGFIDLKPYNMMVNLKITFFMDRVNKNLQMVLSYLKVNIKMVINIKDY
jgi:hypothetical protein